LLVGQKNHSVYINHDKAIEIAEIASADGAVLSCILSGGVNEYVMSPNNAVMLSLAKNGQGTGQWGD